MNETQNVAPATDKDTETKVDSKKKKEPTPPSEVKFQSMMPLEEAVSYFEAIIAGMKKQSIHFKQGDASLHLQPPGHLNVEVKAGSKKDKQRICFEIEWQMAGETKLTISSE